MRTLAFLAVVAVVGLVLFAWFVRQERRGQPIKIVVLILGLLVAESFFYNNPFHEPVNIFHPVDLGVSFRLPDLLIPMALVAHVVVHGWRFRLQATALLWLAFVFWVAAEIWMGITGGNSVSLALFEGKLIVYLSFFLFVSDIPATDLVHGRIFRRFLYASGAVAAVAVVLDVSKQRFSANIPGLPLEGFGSIGADTATLFLGLGLLAAALALVTETSRLKLLLTATPLIFASAEANQRAAVIAMGASLLTLAVVGLMGWRRLRITPTELLLTGLTFLALLVLPVLVTATTGKGKATVPLARQLRIEFTSRAKELSAQDRTFQWAKAKEEIEQRPLTGWGLGKTYTHFDPGFKVFVTTDLTHNIELDLLVRTGIVGLVMFFAAFALTTRDAVRSWLGHPDAFAAAFALGCISGLIGLLAKGAVESIFEKFRLATLMGFLVGAVASITLSRLEPVVERRRAGTELPVEVPAWR